MSAGANLRCWRTLHAARPLSAAQQAYAATDAYCLVALFSELLRRQQQQQQQKLGTLVPLSPAWMAHMAGACPSLVNASLAGAHEGVAVGNVPMSAVWVAQGRIHCPWLLCMRMHGPFFRTPFTAA